MWGVGCRVWGVGCGVWGVGCGVWGVGCRVHDGPPRVSLPPPCTPRTPPPRRASPPLRQPFPLPSEKEEKVVEPQPPTLPRLLPEAMPDSEVGSYYSGFKVSGFRASNDTCAPARFFCLVLRRGLELFADSAAFSASSSARNSSA